MTNLHAHTLTKPHPPRKLAKTNKAHCNKYKLKIETEEKPSLIFFTINLSCQYLRKDFVASRILLFSETKKTNYYPYILMAVKWSTYHNLYEQNSYFNV
jgi:hypothetical protein